jgi:hypothetical protein
LGEDPTARRSSVEREIADEIEELVARHFAG